MLAYPDSGERSERARAACRLRIRSSVLVAMCQNAWPCSPFRSGEVTMVSANSGRCAARNTHSPQHDRVAANSGWSATSAIRLPRAYTSGF